MSIAILVNGAAGRMGQIACKAIEKHPRFTLVGQTGRLDPLPDAIKKTHAQVVVDLTHPSAVFANTAAIIAAGARPVIGTTGLQAHDIETLSKQCEKAKLGGIIAPNFSISATLLIEQAKAIAKYMTQVEIIEMHHDDKADSPSGTAINAAQQLKRANPKLNEPHKPSHETIAHARGANADGIPIHAIRLPGLLAYLQIIFGTPGETLTLTHNTIDRECFMPGLILSCEKVMDLDHLVYGLHNLL